jgi:hypothetical protein
MTVAAAQPAAGVASACTPGLDTATSPRLAVKPGFTWEALDALRAKTEMIQEDAEGLTVREYAVRTRRRLPDGTLRPDDCGAGFSLRSRLDTATSPRLAAGLPGTPG